MMELNISATHYFHMGFSYKEILCSLAVMNCYEWDKKKFLIKADKPLVCLIL